MIYTHHFLDISLELNMTSDLVVNRATFTNVFWSSLECVYISTRQETDFLKLHCVEIKSFHFNVMGLGIDKLYTT